MEQLGLLLGFLVSLVVLLSAFGSIIIWMIRLEGSLKTQTALIEERKLAHVDQIAALVKQQEMLLQLCNDYRAHTEQKLDGLSRDIKENFRIVFDKLDNKADKV